MVISEMGGADGVSSAEHETTLIKLKNKMLFYECHYFDFLCIGP